ncbi:hypothetical protein [Coralliovum pocilloporae]|uniref:hypothetical protein n=1 Tax=Coralliovum pocilloporae TaxID=3066369 RepID=UPI003306A62A
MELEGRLQILIVTPERTIFQHWSKMLRDSGARHFYHASDAPSMLKHLRNGVIDVIFVDGIIRFINPLQLSAVLTKAMQQLKREMPALVLCQKEDKKLSPSELKTSGYSHQIITPVLKPDSMARVVEEIVLTKRAGYEMARVRPEAMPEAAAVEQEPQEQIQVDVPRNMPVPEPADSDVAFL